MRAKTNRFFSPLRSLALLAGLSVATSAQAELACDEIMTMVGYGIGDSVIIQAMQSAGGGYTSEQVLCLVEGGAPGPVLAAAQAMQGGSAAAPPAGGGAMTRPDPGPDMSEEDLGEDLFLPADDFADTVDNGPEDEAFGEEQGPSEVETLVQMYRARKYLTASKGLFDLLQADTYPEHKSKITYYLAKALFDLELYHGAQYYFKEVVRQGPRNPYFKYALPKLVSIAQINGNDAELLSFVELIPPEQFPRQAKNHLSYLMGRKLYEQGELTDALRFFQQVSPRSELFMRSKYFEGVIHNERSKFKSAVKAFRDVYQAEVPATDERTALELKDLQDLALVNIARIYYGLERFENADNYYSLVDRGSLYWPQSLFERSWATFMQNDLNLTLGLLLTTRTPYYDDREFLPEATVLRGLTFFSLCEYDEVERLLLDFEDDYQPMKMELRSFLAEYSTEDGRALADQAFEHYFEDAGTTSSLNESFFLHLLRNRDIAGIVRHMDMMDEEEIAIDAQKAIWRDTVGSAIKQVMERDRQRYKRRAGLAMLREMTQQYQYITDLISQSEIVRFEVVDAQRLDYQYRATNPLIESLEERTVDFATSRDIIYWPFNGEFWDDELGYYRYTESTSCN
ncbi:MAG: hypothetical protein ACJATT_000792 [Myxococcota bacterium]|jgi:TolA-binding protein